MMAAQAGGAAGVICAKAVGNTAQQASAMANLIEGRFMARGVRFAKYPVRFARRLGDHASDFGGLAKIASGRQ